MYLNKISQLKIEGFSDVIDAEKFDLRLVKSGGGLLLNLGLLDLIFNLFDFFRFLR